MSISTLARRIQTLKVRSHSDPLIYFRPTPPQKAFIEDNPPQKIKLLLGGNQIGKTWASAAMLLMHALGRHPTIPGIVRESWLVCYSHEQSRIIQQKLYDLCPKYALAEDCEFVRGKGFRGLSPIVRFKEEYGGAIIRIKTASQQIGLESGTCGLVVIDEPVNSEVLNSAIARTTRGGPNGTRGIVALSLTPVGNVDLSYLKKMIEENRISVHRAPLSVENTTPIGCRPLMSEEQINAMINAFLPIDREQRVNASLDIVPSEGVIFDNFDLEMISSHPVPPGGTYEFCIGIDHGSTPNSQCAILSCVDTREPSEPRVYVLDEYISGQAPPETHVRGILEMCKRNGLKPEQIRTWIGDGVHHANRTRDGFKMSNILLMRSFEHILGYPSRNLPFTIRRPIKWRNSVYYTVSLIHSVMSRKHFFIHPNCKRLITSIKNWTLKRTQSARSTDEYGHACDAMRYGLASLLDRRYARPARLEIR